MFEDLGIEIKGLIESSFLDWDGKIVSTIYLSNCNLRCPFCHNWELIEHPENYKTIPSSELMQHLRANNDFLDGVCITGGEPTLYNELPGLIDYIRSMDYAIKLDTNGTNPKLLSELITENKLDYIAMDIKAPLDERYNKLAGIDVDLDKIKKSIQLIMDSTIDYEFRTTLVPGLLTKQDVSDLSLHLSSAKKYVFQQYVPDHARVERLRKVKPYSRQEFDNFLKIAQNNIKHVVIRGLK